MKLRDEASKGGFIYAIEGRRGDAWVHPKAHRAQHSGPH